MYPTLQVDMAQALDPDPLRSIDEVPDLDRVPGEERNLLQERAPPRVLAREWLDEAGQLGEEEVDERPCDELRDPAAAAVPAEPRAGSLIVPPSARRRSRYSGIRIIGGRS